MNSKNLLLVAAIAFTAVAQAQLPFGETKEFQDVLLSMSGNFEGPDGSNWFPFDEGKPRRVP